MGTRQRTLCQNTSKTSGHGCRLCRRYHNGTVAAHGSTGEIGEYTSWSDVADQGLNSCSDGSSGDAFGRNPAASRMVFIKAAGTTPAQKPSKGIPVKFIVRACGWQK